MSQLQKNANDDLLTKYHNRLQNDYRYFAAKSLQVKAKSGQLLPFIFNQPQNFLHAALEKQLMATGKIRALILKGRQEGCSTYIAGRFYWKATRNQGQSVFVLSHEADTTEKLFQMVGRFHELCPDPVKAKTDIENRRRIVFTGLESEYFVGTAGNENVGRGGTVQLLHASEAAFYPSAVGFSTGLLQSVPDLPGTEVILESTANGMDPVFYVMCMDALAGKSEYQLIFLPWFWMLEYRKKVPEDFKPTEEEEDLKRTYLLDDEQIFWRRMKIAELKDVKLFMREYPNNIHEAFTTTGSSLINPQKIMDARKSNVIDKEAALIMGVDPNEHSAKGSIAFRRGRQMLKHFEIEGRKPMEWVGIIANFIDTHCPVKCFIDVSQGWSIVDRLNELGYGNVVVGIMFGEGALEDNVYLNRRAEMWCLMCEWFDGGGVSCPDEDLLHKHLVCVPGRKKTSSGLTKLEPKEKIIEDTGIDPHIGDAYALTFAMPVRRPDLPHTRVRGKRGEAKVILKTSQFRKSMDSDARNNSASTNINWG